MRLSPCPTKPASARGFSLIEMVVVMAVVAMMVAVVTPAMSGMVSSTRLTSAGNMVTNLAAQARQMAMTKNSVTALAILGGVGSEDDYRKLAIMEYQSKAGWVQATPWQSLPVGVVVDFSDRDTCTFLKDSGVPLPLSPSEAAKGELPFKYNGTALTSATCALRVFLANGGLHDSESPARIRLVEGFKNGEALQYQHVSTAGVPGNYYDVSLIGATGLAKIGRP